MSNEVKAHYRVSITVNGETRYLRVNASGNDWTPDINEATTWPTAGEAAAVARALPRVAGAAA